MVLQNGGILSHQYRCHNLEDHDLNLHCNRHLKSCIGSTDVFILIKASKIGNEMFRYTLFTIIQICCKLTGEDNPLVAHIPHPHDTFCGSHEL
jgi:hypothetical protein